MSLIQFRQLIMHRHVNLLHFIICERLCWHWSRVGLTWRASSSAWRAINVLVHQSYFWTFLTTLDSQRTCFYVSSKQDRKPKRVRFRQDVRHFGTLRGSMKAFWRERWRFRDTGAMFVASDQYIFVSTNTLHGSVQLQFSNHPVSFKWLLSV